MNVEGVFFNDTACVADYGLLLDGMGPRSVLVIRGYVVDLYLPERAENTAVVPDMKDPKWLQIRSLRNVGAGTLTHASNSGIHRNQIEV